MTLKIKTKWELRTYDVWGNAKDGYEVNDTFRKGEIEMELKVEIFNGGTPQEFFGAFPTDKQLKKALEINCKFKIGGDDTMIYIERAKDCYPLGEIYCLNYKSLSPIQAK